MSDWIIGITIIALLGGLAVVYFLKSMINENKNLKEKAKDLTFQKKSSEVRLGNIGEQMAPLLKDWPYNPTNFRFLGSPIDGIAFEDDEIVFIEIKTGKARLSKKQKDIKSLVNEGKVRFATFRIGENYTNLKVEDYAKVVRFPEKTDP
jgi:predicted Holliday junction resolvase-like endonuclease